MALHGSLDSTMNEFAVNWSVVHVRFSTGEVGAAPREHARGSHGCKFDVTGEGAAITPEVVVAAGSVVGAEIAGVSTENCVPVTTVTCAPSTT
jgi:hypothetical protein